MDIIQELKEINGNQNSLSNILSHLDSQKEEMNKKLYLLRVLYLADAIDEKIKNGYFRENNVTKFEISSRAFGTLNIYFYDKEDLPYIEMKDIEKICKELNEFKTKYANEELRELSTKAYKSRLDKNFRIKLFDALLSDELKTVLNYSKMSLELDNKNVQSQKLKM